MRRLIPLAMALLMLVGLITMPESITQTASATSQTTSATSRTSRRVGSYNPDGEYISYEVITDGKTVYFCPARNVFSLFGYNLVETESRAYDDEGYVNVNLEWDENANDFKIEMKECAHAQTRLLLGDYDSADTQYEVISDGEQEYLCPASNAFKKYGFTLIYMGPGNYRVYNSHGYVKLTQLDGWETQFNASKISIDRFAEVCACLDCGYYDGKVVFA